MISYEELHTCKFAFGSDTVQIIESFISFRGLRSLVRRHQVDEFIRDKRSIDHRALRTSCVNAFSLYLYGSHRGIEAFIFDKSELTAVDCIGLLGMKSSEVEILCSVAYLLIGCESYRYPPVKYIRIILKI